MALPGETKGLSKEIECIDCGEKLKLQVCRSAAGYYLGYYCNTCGPYSRETDYYRKGDDAQKDLDKLLEKDIVPSTIR